MRDQVKAFMFAGYDTTASSLIFAVDSITRDMSVQQKIFAEKDLGYKAAVYTQAAYKESLRLYPSAYFLPRQAAGDDVICGQKINAGSQIFISVRHVQRCSEVYKDPDQFLPERFLEAPAHSHAFIPFGEGNRICIGAALAMMEATVVLQKLCERYKLTPAMANPPEIEGLITAHTKSPLLVRLERRPTC
jgi:cytochrome P450